MPTRRQYNICLLTDFCRVCTQTAHTHTHLKVIFLSLSYDLMRLETVVRSATMFKCTKWHPSASTTNTRTRASSTKHRCCKCSEAGCSVRCLMFILCFGHDCYKYGQLDSFRLFSCGRLSQQKCMQLTHNAGDNKTANVYNVVRTKNTKNCCKLNAISCIACCCVCFYILVRFLFCSQCFPPCQHVHSGPNALFRCYLNTRRWAKKDKQVNKQTAAGSGRR